MFVTNHLYHQISVGSQVIVNVRDEDGCPISSDTGHVVDHIQQPGNFGQSLIVKSSETGKSLLAEGGDCNTEVYLG